MTERLSSDYASYRDAAAAILTRHDGPAAVETFGLHDVFLGEHGVVDYAPAYAFLEAQGHQAATTPALSMLALSGTAGPPDPRLGRALPFGRGPLLAAVGMTASTTLVVDRPGTGLVSLANPVARRRATEADDYLSVVVGDGPAVDVLVSEAHLAPLRSGLLARARLGASAELLGVSSRLLDDALAHAKTRRQFGQAIGDFQAVQHMIAWAATDLHQLQCLFDIAVQGAAPGGPEPRIALAVKAMAGRVLHTVTQTAIQVTGAISFTWEYSLNRIQHRGLALDQLAGPSADLLVEIGRSVRSEAAVPELFTLFESGA